MPLKDTSDVKLLRSLIDWFAGGPDGYMTLVHCLNSDWTWIGVTVALNLGVALGYLLIALHWRRNERKLPDSPAKAALGSMKNIFLFCGLCGYVFIPIKMFWPAWRLYNGFLVLLVYLTWRYALGTRQLEVVYNEIGRSVQLELDLEDVRKEGQRRSAFLNAVSHDLRTPLNGLMLQAELAELGLATPDEAMLRESLAQIKNCARTTAELLGSLLELGQLDWADESLLVNDFSWEEIRVRLEESFRGRAKSKGLGLRFEPSSGVVFRTDRLKLERLVSNLVDNAIKYTTVGGVRVSLESTIKGPTIDVVDSGEGIASKNLRRIFEDFTQVHNRERDSRKGFGLGLAIARRLARDLGGHITVESEPGRGSRFTIRLPATVLATSTGSRSGQ